MKQIKLSEEQDKEIRRLIMEQLPVNSDLGKKVPGGNLKADFTPDNENTPLTTIVNNMNNAQNTNKVGGQTVPIEAEVKSPNGQDKKSLTLGSDNIKSESFLISKRQLDEMRLKKLKENSEVVKVEKFLK